MDIQSDLRSHLRHHHLGRQNAVKREELLFTVRSWGYAIGDRDLREAYAAIGACACGDGVFWPATFAEVEATARYLDDKAIGHFERAKHLRSVHSGLRREAQLELW